MNKPETTKSEKAWGVFTYKFRLYPTEIQAQKMSESLETCRRLYNGMLQERKETNIKFFEQKRGISKARKDDKFLQAVQLRFCSIPSVDR